MPTPSEAEVRSQIGNAVKLVHEVFLKASTSSPNVVGLYDTLIQSLETDYASEVASGAQAVRNAVAAALDGPLRRMVEPLLRDYMRVINRPERDVQGMWQALYDYFVANTLTVQKRAFTFGSVSAGGGNSGDGTINRLTKDENNFDLEATMPDVFTAECVADEHSGGTVHEEAFEFRSGDASVDGLEQLGMGIVAQVSGLSGRGAQQFVRNPSFDQLDGASITAPDSIPGWTVTGAIANFQLDDANYYRGFEGNGGTPRSLRFEVNDKITQLLSVRRAQFNPRIPYYCQIAVNRQVYTGDGTITLRVGAKSAAIVLVAQTGWNILRIALDSSCWHKNLNEQTFNVEVELSSNTTGDILVDDLIVGPFANVGGTYYAIVGGTVPFLRRDTFTWTDTCTDSILQRWFARGWGRYLPHAAAAPSWAEP